MKATILAVSIAALLTLHSRAQSPITITDIDPKLTLQHLNGSSVVNGTGLLRFGVDISGADPVGLYKFDSNVPLTSWIWSLTDSTTSTTHEVMMLQEDGILALMPTGSSAAGLTLHSNGTLDFGSGTSTRYLHLNGSDLRFGTTSDLASTGSVLLTRSVGDSLYLAPANLSFHMGSGATAATDYAFAFGDQVSSSGRGAVAVGAGSTWSYGDPAPLTAIGSGAVALGLGSWANGDAATSIGKLNGASGVASIAIGRNNSAWGEASISIGDNNFVPIADGTAIGWYNGVEGAYAIALGSGNSIETTGGQSFAAGHGNWLQGPLGVGLGYCNQVTSNGWSAVAVGRNNEAGAPSAFAAGGYNQADGWYGATIGVGLQSQGSGQIVIGSYNEPKPDATGLVRTDTDVAFIIGNGYQTSATSTDPIQIDSYYPENTHSVRSNAFLVHWNGHTEAKGNIDSTATTGYNKFKAPILIPESGDISMGEFTAGDQP